MYERFLTPCFVKSSDHKQWDMPKSSVLSARLETQIHACKSGFSAFYLLVVVYFPEKVGRKGRRGRQKLKLEEEKHGGV